MDVWVWAKTLLAFLFYTVIGTTGYENEFAHLRLQQMIAYPCHYEMWTYTMTGTQRGNDDCVRSQQIRYTNLLLLIINVDCLPYNKTHKFQIRQLEYKTDLRCVLGNDRFTINQRRECFNEDFFNETEIDKCGATKMRVHILTLLTATLYL
ncbi:uncharacterized protein LOC116162577 [Photinus pyralis]|uniref:uncharacterized protein LOC116162577 n=1 Tax=Photinus pyralis TaxID=7054 RepID=UPI0012675742|nr:uncharacterized protein LOC116162577 [Photinus pyralis]